ncbi:hypothetical protein [Lusitaniella coriacea]|uniref:hypothetical protein n=1 Tax=Lusitaniella coriacea TaxID=1983105 RepID=UPI001D158F7E|nr:hypothetical protein [Lusitaniella coriacea]
MGWLLDLEESSICVCGADRSVQLFENLELVLPLPEFAKIAQLKVGQIFNGLKEQTYTKSRRVR